MPATILAEIAERRRQAIAERRKAFASGLPPRPGAFGAPRLGTFRRALARADQATPVRLLCEIKKASPSRGVIRADFDPDALAAQYKAGGAAALSVLTEPDYFQGDPSYLTRARAASGLPCLLKDFVLDPWQLDEAVSLGADAVLLIVALLPMERLDSLVRQARVRGLDTLVEVHTDAELDLALAVGGDLIGINNRDLATFELDPGVTLALRPRIPAGVTVVSESGIGTPDDIARLTRANVDAALIGEAFMREADVAAAVRRLADAALAAVQGFVTVGIKICGLTRLEDALVALDAGADALGFILADGSPRRLAPLDASALLAQVRERAPRSFQAVAVLGAYDATLARRALSELGFDRAQLVGSDPDPAPALGAALAALGPLAARAWGAIRVRDKASLAGLDEAPCEAFVLDAWKDGALGGTGHAFDWTLAAPLASRRRVVLAGGLTADNVAGAIRTVKPWRVDVASGVEDSPGIKNAEKIRAFVEAVHHA